MKVFLSFLVEREHLASDCSLLGVNLSLLLQGGAGGAHFIPLCL